MSSGGDRYAGFGEACETPGIWGDESEDGLSVGADCKPGAGPKGCLENTWGPWR